ncbi:hypothetical protein [Microlunatus soli]|uniref:hypothetical protein n=1 Tax=Microlunatus soli TaxID=630515 RepID=UPI000B818AF6|nr:hypothetical protein [Microlunatus soli]
MEAATGVRDIWYLNLLHFAGPIADPDGLLDWVESHRETFIGTITIDECRLIRWDYRVIDGRYDLLPVTLAASTFTQPNLR